MIDSQWDGADQAELDSTIMRWNKTNKSRKRIHDTEPRKSQELDIPEDLRVTVQNQ